jgi:hypothetical protein
MTTLTLWDDVNANLIPSDAEYVGFYVDGTYANEKAIAAHCPKAKLVSIAVREADNADVLDVETGDAQIADIYYWLHRGQMPKTARLPVIYTSVGNVDRMMLTMHANNFVHGKDFLIWSAHYTGTPHICGPTTCAGTRTTCDATQWTNHAMGQSLDESECMVDFFKAAPVVVPPAPKNITLTIGGSHIELTPGRAYTLTVEA